MTDKARNDSNSMRRPKGFSPGLRGPAGENAHEQGWQLNEEERTRVAKSLQGRTGGRDFIYGARDFGDKPVDTSSSNGQNPSAQQTQAKQSSIKVNSNPRDRARS
jgi:hypothetical protein